MNKQNSSEDTSGKKSGKTKQPLSAENQSLLRLIMGLETTNMVFLLLFYKVTRAGEAPWWIRGRLVATCYGSRINALSCFWTFDARSWANFHRYSACNAHKRVDENLAINFCLGE